MECINNLQASLQTSTNSSITPVQKATETKINMNKLVCELALSSYHNLDDFKQELKKLSSLVSFTFNKKIMIWFKIFSI